MTKRKEERSKLALIRRMKNFKEHSLKAQSSTDPIVKDLYILKANRVKDDCDNLMIKLGISEV